MSVIPEPIWKPIDIVYGVYALQGDYTGDDRWWIQRLVESDTGWMVHNDIFFDSPEKRYVTLDVELSEGWEWCYLNLRDDRGTLLAAEVEGDKLIVEHNFELSEFPFDRESELDYISPFMNSITLRRLLLEPGRSVTRPVIWFDPDSFAPQLVEQSYHREEQDTVLEIDGQQITAQQIHFHNHTSGYRTTLLVREDGLVLSYPPFATLTLDERASSGRGRMPPLDSRADR